ncbi:hypothetical protein BCON_0051g00390 [Botryotinia convoluta]|uniref:Uncharacterized protein n=1 Tax=Botryotinia convoluta TaxID=54673 RepID=A0A4Z1IB04_9HELO|nr:hypothetical protein BCON_0051g00390 [Botryotinia convoluta]
MAAYNCIQGTVDLDIGENATTKQPPPCIICSAIPDWPSEKKSGNRLGRFHDLQLVVEYAIDVCSL